MDEIAAFEKFRALARQKLASSQEPRRTAISRLGLDLLAFATTALGYYACAAIGTVLSVPPSGFAIIWPATAFLMSLFLIFPPARWWPCIAGAVLTHFYIAAALQPDAPFAVVLTQIGGNLALALSSVIALRLASGNRVGFDSLRAVVTFIVLAGVAVPAFVNALILAVHLATGWAEDFWLSWQQWMVAGLFPTITIPPVLLLLYQGGLTGHTTAAYPCSELAISVVAIFAVSFVSFGGRLDTASWPALFLAPLPLLLTASVRLGVGGTSVSLVALASAIIAQALRHNGPFANHAPAEDVTSLQVFLITTSLPLILLAALMDERRRTMRLLHQSEARILTAASSTDTGLWQWDQASRQLWLTDHCRAMFGLQAVEASSPRVFLERVHPDDQARMERAIESAMATPGDRKAEDYRIECEGESRWLLLSMNSQADKTGNVQLSGVFRDVTNRVVSQIERDDLLRRMARIQEDERRRIAEELHDSTTQYLVAARLNLSVLKSKVRSVSTRSLLTQAMDALKEASMEVRTISYLLHPPQLERVGLCGVLREYVSGFESRSGIRTTVRVNALADLLPLDQQHALLRIAQESLGNVFRHARAKQVSVGVRCLLGNVHLIVSDDGKGIEPEDGRQIGERLNLGVGIAGMSARVRQLHGRIDIDGSTKGTTVHVVLPIGVMRH